MKFLRPYFSLNLLILCFLVTSGISCTSGSTGVGDFESGKRHETVVKQPIGQFQLNVLGTTPIITDWIVQVSGDRLKPKSVIPNEINPHAYHPGSKDIAKIIETDLIFTVGLEYEDAWLIKLIDNHKYIKIVKLGDFVTPMEFHNPDRDNTNTRSHLHKENLDSKKNHNHGQIDPHFWFDPFRVSKAVIQIAEALSDIDPDGADYYKTNASKYIGELENLDEHIKIMIETLPANKKVLITAHESLGYLASRYDLKVLRAVIPNLNSDVDPTPRDITSIINIIRDNDVRVIFLENETSDKSAQVVANETGVKLRSGLMVETLKHNQTYVDFMKNNIAIIVSNLISN